MKPTVVAEWFLIYGGAVNYHFTRQLLLDAFQPFALHIRPGLAAEDSLHGGTDTNVKGNESIPEGGLAHETNNRCGNVLIPRIRPRTAEIGVGVAEGVQFKPQGLQLSPRQVTRALDNYGQCGDLID